MSQDAEDLEPEPGMKPMQLTPGVYAELTDRKRRATIRRGRRVTYSEILERLLEATRDMEL